IPTEKSDSGSPVFYSRDLPFVSLLGIHMISVYSKSLGDIMLTIKLQDIFNKAPMELVL
ncbi:36543_t:CDS:1, partial [Racocetra persica]